MTIDANDPVLVGVGVAHQRTEDPRAALDAIALMASACDRAGVDADAPSLLADTGLVLVPRGTWRHPDPGRALAERVGARARTVVADIGILQQTLLTRACLAVRSGDVPVALVVGGEARFRDVSARRAGIALDDPAGDGQPDEVLRPESEILPRAEVEAGFVSAPLQYAALETALRAARGASIEEHAQSTARLWAAFSAVASRNPDAWRREPVTADELARPSAVNPMLAAPYTKWHCSQWNVDQAAALVVCSAETAARHGVPRDRWVFPVAAAESNHMVPVSRRAELHRSPAVAEVGRALGASSGLDPASAGHADLYSCFPAAVRIQATEWGMAEGPALTVGGGMTFAGGPLNNAVLQALARLVDMLRADPGSTGLITSVSGMLTKHGGSLWSTEPPSRGFTAVDVTNEAARSTTVLDLAHDHRGPAVVAGYSVAHEEGEPVSVHVVATAPDGRRVAARGDDRALAAAMVAEEWVGREVHVDGHRCSA